jgi:hypothetical protein
VYIRVCVCVCVCFEVVCGWLNQYAVTIPHVKCYYMGNVSCYETMERAD